MSLIVDDVWKKMLDAAAKSFGAEWQHVSKFVPAELKKLSVQLVDIAENVAKYEQNHADGYPPITGQVLLQMQQRALEATLTAVTALTLITIQTAIRDILAIVKDAFGGVLEAIIP